MSASFALAGPVWAQDAPGASRPVVQALPSSEAIRLNAALSKLGKNPRDVDALIDAGSAASDMRDYDAAIGFYKRAEQIAPGNPVVQGGLASALARSGDPFSAIPLFEKAERAGANSAELAGDRALAFDLVGDTANAQRYYRLALARRDDDEIRRRLALSLAISGDESGSEATLLPMLRKQDKSAWRARAFALAIVGKTSEAIKITETLLPKPIASGITPYLRYMPRLTAAQQAAAANLGRFPRASEIGMDDPRVSQYALVSKRTPAIASSADGSANRDKTPVQAKERSRRQDIRKVDVSSSASARAEPPVPKPEKRIEYAPPGSEVVVANGGGTETGSRASLAQRGQAVAGATGSFASNFGDIGRPAQNAAPVNGAVDITAIEPAKPKPVVEAKPRPPAHPSRIWVQIGIGRDKSALSFDWRRLKRTYPDALKGREAFVSDMGQTNRMVIGPFASDKEARDFASELRKAGMKGPYMWTSPTGQVVDVLR